MDRSIAIATVVLGFNITKLSVATGLYGVLETVSYYTYYHPYKHIRYEGAKRHAVNLHFG